ncbi:MAG: alpha-xylosidase [candidate division KSB1 bacterium]|nr:alpha-xylosidase [candidate division KSB1 bacterium]
MLSNNIRRYIHYEIPEQAIFNPDRWDFRHVQKVLSWRSAANALRLHLALSDGSEAELEMFAWSDDILRFRFGESGATFRESSEMLVGVPSPGNLEVEQAGSRLIARTRSLAVQIGLDPWSLRLEDSRGRKLQSTHDSGPWKSFFPLYPLGLQQGKAGEPTRVFASFDLEPLEAVYGLGEKFGPLNKRGQSLVSWNSDTTNCSMDRAYKNVPFLMTTAGYGLFLHDSHRIEYEIGSWSHTALSFAVENPSLEWFFLYGPSLKELLSRYTELTGRASMPPLWSFGLWMSRCGYRNRKELEEVAAELRRRKIPCDVLHLDPFWMHENHYCDFEWDLNAFPEPQEMLARLGAEGFKVCLWEQPYVPAGTEMFREGDSRGYFVRDAEGKTLLIPDFLENQVGLVDFTHPEARRWYQDKHRGLLQMGVAVFKTDMGEAVPREAVFADGRTGAEMHNLYPLLYGRTVWEAVATKWGGTGLVWGRSAYAGSQRYPVHWGGDSISTPEEMMAVLRGGLSWALSGGAFWSQDIGGFQGKKPDPWLYVRWAQWGLFNSHSRCHGVQPREPWAFGDKAEEIFRRFAELRYQLLPYLWGVAREASYTGLPVMRPLVLEFQDDPTTWNLDTEYLFGPSLLIVPVFDQAGRVHYYLPPGLWLDFWRDRKLEGPRWVEETVPLEEMPIFLRDGALIGMAPISQYVGESPWEKLSLTVFLTVGRAQALLVDDRGGEIRVEASRETKAAQLRWSGSAAAVEILWRSIEKPRSVLWKETPIPTGGGQSQGFWDYDAEIQRLRIVLPPGAESWEVKLLF